MDTIVVSQMNKALPVLPSADLARHSATHCYYSEIHGSAIQGGEIEDFIGMTRYYRGEFEVAPGNTGKAMNNAKRIDR